MPSRANCVACPPGKVCTTAGITTPAATDCPTNTFCPEASTAGRLCPLGTYSVSTGITKDDDCTACIPGTACKQAATSAETCPQGYYCLDRTYLTTETPCPDVTYGATTGLQTKASCTACTTAGKYCVEGSLSEKSCDIGYMCAGSAGKVACGAGTYSSALGGSSCGSCPAGKICPVGYHEINPISCPKGYFMASTGSSGPCTICTAGYMCPTAGMSTPTGCSNGQWTIEGQISCDPCPAGYYCAGNVKTVCGAGYYCPIGSSAPAACTGGYYCPGATGIQLICPPGQTSGATASICVATTAGFFTKQAQSDTVMASNPCAPGYFCETGAKGSIHKPCPPGTYVAAGATASGSCLPCTAGSYCMEGTSSTTLTICPLGNYCPTGSAIPTKCPRGTYRATTGATILGDCTNCDAGKVCSQDGLSAPDLDCDPGYYCQTKASTSQPTDLAVGGYCGEGTYCPKGASAQVSCPAGKFNVFKGCRSVAECLDCPFGFICDGTTGINALCPAGSYCPGGTTTATLQSPAKGYHTIVGQGAQIPCIPGTFTAATGQTSCTSCTPGKSCDTSHLDPPNDCTTGHFCPDGTIQPFYCREGTFRATIGATALADCTPCTGGNYCTGLGLIAITNTCDAGFYCTAGAFHPKPAYTSATVAATFGLCPPGQYCGPSTTTPTDCGIGKYSPASGNALATDCFDCIPGKYCPNAVMANPSGDCSVGYYCPSGSSSATATICPKGSYCVVGSPQPIKCPAGKYQNTDGLGACINCPEGKYCVQGSDTDGVICPQGYYCPLNTGDYKVFPCDPGTYGAATGLVKSADCTPCTTGQYCTNYGQSAPTPSCSAGYYCTLNARSPTPVITAQGGKCTAGELCVAGSGATAPCTATYVCNAEIMSTVTVKCHDGFKCGTGLQYMNPEGLGAIGDFCTPGSWCQGGIETQCVAPTYQPSKGAGVIGITECLQCPYGFYCATNGLATPTGSCPAGYYCGANQIADITNACPAGFECPAGAIQKTPCAAGTYQNSATQAACLACTTTNFCLYDSLLGTPAQTTCPLGTFCLGGSLDRPTSCTAGNYQDLTGQTTCKACTAGNYCDRIQMTAQSACPAGYYCDAGQTSAKLNRCTPGFYCPAGSTAAVPCPAGQYCADHGLSAPSGTCSPGYYCTLQATVPNPTDGATGNICSAGYYCPDGTLKTACAIGTYNEKTGSDNVADCLACLAGMQCASAGLAYPSSTCVAGQYCPAGAAPQNCAIGYMCPAGTVQQILCLPGSYQPIAGKATCEDCPAGKYCDFDTLGSGITVAIDCPAGYYCPLKTANYKSYPCGQTTFNPNTGSQDATACGACTDKFYCMSKGQSAVTGPCADGYTCPSGSKLPAISANRCAKNKYCTAGTVNDCPASTFTYSGSGGDVLGATAVANCMYCLPGKMCPNHDTGITDCPAGSYCLNGVSTVCTTGHYCAGATYAPVSCSRGYYAGSTGASGCTQCPVATYCDSIATVTPSTCAADLVCVLGSVKPLPCAHGTYAAANACSSCPAGKWCWKSIAGNNRGDCNDGYICYLGADSPTPFYAGSKQSTDADVNAYNGKAAKGCYTASTLVGKTTVNTPCPAGTYMPSMGATACAPCPAGYYCDTAGIFDITTKICTAGYVCSKSATTPTPIDGTTGQACALNSYCPAGTAFSVRCAEGQMALTTGKATCDACDVGYSCTTAVPHAACSTGNNRCVIGTGREPLCQAGTYLSLTSCVACPTGLFCVDGRSDTGPGTCANNQCCTAGYLCTGGSPTPKPTGLGGNLCDAGYYCPEGAVTRQNCPVDTYIFTSGARQASDCTSCTEGYICTPGVPVPTPCYVGKYCPTGITGALPCPVGTYSNSTRNTIVHNCLSCPSGYLCSAPGIVDCVSYLCPVGKYCFVREQSGISCPYGSYNNLTGGKAVTDCQACVSGYYCPELGQSNATANSCIGGQLCSPGTAYPAVCPQGYYCSNVTGYLQAICPVNYYCPPNTTNPIACTTGEYCPAGSKFPIKCVAGQISVRSSGNLVCETCPAGTYSTSGLNTACQTCEAGYVCLEGTNAQYPWDVDYHNGYKCPPGAYCPAGSSKPTYCAKGTYNPLEGQSQSKVCLLCKGNTFSPSEGQGACLPCGDSATSDPGASTCICKGKNRAFLISDFSCRCKPGYEYLENGVMQTDVNSKVDCQPIIYNRCSETQIRGYDGKCLGKSDCDKECGGSGIRSPTLGICQCKEVQKLDSVCNKACRDSMPTMTIASNGKIRVNAASDPYNYNPVYLTPLTISNFSSEYMTCAAGKACSAKSVRIGNDGRISSTYGLGPRLGLAYLNQTSSTSTRRLLSDGERRRLLATVTSTEIDNPVICIHEGDTLLFEVDGNGHYPVYQKDSLLNSNDGFDYGAFKVLAETVAAQIANGENPAQYFGYTFSANGRYFFTDSISTEKTMVVSVTKASEKCPNENAYLQPRTSGTLSVFGLALNDSIMLEPDYIMLLIILVAFVLALAMFMFLLRWVTEHMWKSKDTSDPLFREDHKKFDVRNIALGAKAGSVPVDLAGANQYGIFKDIDRPDALGGGMESSFLAEFSESVNMQKLEELDPFIIDKILKDYQAYKDYLQKELLVACEKQSKQIEDLGSAIEKMKFLLNERYEKLIALLKLDVDYTKLTNVKIKMEEEKDEGKKREKRIKPSDIKLAKSDEKTATDVLKQISAKRNEANVVNELYNDDEAMAGEEEAGEAGANKNKTSSGAAAPKTNEELEERIKKNFEERLKQMGDLSDFEKNKLRDELTSELINLECVLAGEKETQEIAIRRLLQGRKKKKVEPTKAPEHISESDMSPEEKLVKAKVEQQIDDEARDRQRDIEQRALAKIQKSKDRLLSQLGAPANLSEKEKEIILSGHKAELEQMFDNIKQDKDKQLEDLQQRLERRKKAKVAEQIHAMREEQQPEAPVEDTESVVSIPKEALNSEVVEKLKDEETKRQADLAQKHQEENKRLAEAHSEEIKEKEAELVEDLELEVEKEVEVKKDKIEEKFKQRQQEVEDQRRKLKDMLLFSGGDKDAGEKLMEEIKTKDEQLQQLVESEKKEQDCLIEEKINRRRIAKQKKLLAFKNAQHDTSIEQRLRQLKEKHDVQGQYETEKIKEIVRRARASEPSSTPEESAKLYQMFEQMWNEKEAVELANMFGRQLAEKEGKLRAICTKNIEQKLMEKQAVKDRYKSLYEDLESNKTEMSPDDYAARHRQLRVEEENDLKEMDIKETMNQKKEEFALRQDLEEKSANELTQLQDKLSDDKLHAIRELFGNQHEAEATINTRMKDMKEMIEREKDRRIKDIELDKKIILEKFENDLKERFSNYEDVIKRQRETEKLIKEKKGNIERMIEERKKQMTELKDKALFTPEQEKQLLDKYQQELKSLEAAMESERNRQFAMMREKLESKEGKREREQSYHKKKVAFLMGTVGKNVTLAQAIATKAMGMASVPKNELERNILMWKRDMEEREKSQKTTTFETLQKYLENVGKFKEKGIEGIYLQGLQYQKYLLLMKAAKILQKKLEELHRIKASGALLDLKAALKIFAEDDFDRLKARPERIGGGYRCFDDDGSILWELFKFIHA